MADVRSTAGKKQASAVRSALPRALEQLEEKIGYTFRERGHLEEAMTHSSYSNEMKGRGLVIRCNERLEFLGDSVLSIIASEYLYSHYTQRPEGDLTRMRAEIVCERALSGYAAQIGLGDYLRLGRGEEKNQGRTRKSILADAFEALLAAVYLDAGSAGKKTVSRFLLPFLIEELAALDGHIQDDKTLLQQIIQQVDGELLEYVTVAEHGPDHLKSFVVEARLNSNVIGRGEGRSKREAEQKAAKEALILFGAQKTEV
ncbi:MAG: ribonuclease III [Clostridia bacterium]|nr:ribonuclease III [Clostridia bacterium]